MSEKLNNYLGDLIYLIKEYYNDARREASKSEDENNKAFYNGQEVAYYSVLSLIESQLIAFDEENQLIGKIVPEIGKQADF
jgi:hypothetical protein